MDTSHDGHRQTGGPGPAVASATDGEPVWARAAFHDLAEPLVVLGVSTASEATRLRHEFTTWLGPDVAADLVDDLVLAVHEAVANAAEHAYVDRADAVGPIRLTAHRSRDRLLVTVSDDGRWRVPTNDRFRRRGLPLMRHLVQDVHVSRGRLGTVVHLGTDWPPSRVPFNGS